MAADFRERRGADRHYPPGGARRVHGEVRRGRNRGGLLHFFRRTMPYAASLAGACPRLAAAANLLPEEKRSANSRMIFVPSAVLAALVLLVAGAVFGYSRIEERRYLATLEEESARLQPRVK